MIYVFIALAVAVATFGFTLVATTQTMPNRAFKSNLFTSLLVGFIFGGIALLFESYTSVPQNTRAVQITLGEVSDVSLTEGVHFLNPMSKTVPMSLETFKAVLPAQQAGTNDLQVIHTDLAVNWKIKPSAVVSIYRQYQDNIGNTVLLPVISESLRAVTARHNSEHLITQRDAVSTELYNELRTKLAPHNIEVVNVSLTNFGFSQEYQNAIEQKVVSTQKKQQAEMDLQRVQVEVKSRIAKAEGEAKAIQIQSQAIQSNGGENYVKLQAIEKWDGKLPVYTGGTMPILNLK
jgi:prohibitin 2